MNADTDSEIVATGELYKQQSNGSKVWTSRTFVLSGIHLAYFDKDGVRKGQLNLSDCEVNMLTPEECGSKNARYAFSITGPKKSLVLCASSERNRIAWMILLAEQIDEYQDVIRRYLKTGEELIANVVVKKKNTFGLSANVRLVVANFPRILFIDPKTCKLLHQFIWTRSSPPVLTKISDTKFKILMFSSYF
jgi:hypothetical protein